MGQTMVEKICQRHLAEGPDRPLRTGDVISLRPRHVMTHDNTSPVIKKFKGIGATKVQRSEAAGLHPRPRDPEHHRGEPRQVPPIEEFAKQHGIDFHPAGTGIGHQIMGRSGLRRARLAGAWRRTATRTCTAPSAPRHAGGAHGRRRHLGHRRVLVADAALDQGHADRQAAAGVTGKDVIITLCGLYNKGEVLNAARRVRRVRAWRT